MRPDSSGSTATDTRAVSTAAKIWVERGSDSDSFSISTPRLGKTLNRTLPSMRRVRS